MISASAVSTGQSAALNVVRALGDNRPGETSQLSSNPPTAPTRPGDDVQFSERARRLAGLVTQPSQVAENTDEPSIRLELVQRIRAEIAAGTYDSPERLAIAADNAARSLRGER
jgi:anti-sigma28 factor (negative regulator of flagellin synthesis)